MLMTEPESGSGRSGTRIPSSSKLRDPILEALQALGGRATIADLDRRVGEQVGLSPEELAEPHDPSRGGLGPSSPTAWLGREPD